MSDTDETKRCARCGAEFTPSSSPLGVCPSCLLKLGMSDPAMTPPPVEEPEPELIATVASASEPAAVRRLRLPSRRVWIAIASLLAIATGAITSRFLQSPARQSDATHAQAVRFTLALPGGIQLPEAAQFAVSEDGTQVVVAARREDGMQSLWLRRLQSTDWRELPRTERATFPFWSPDGRHIGFFAGRYLKRIDISNDVTETLCDVENGVGGTWSSQGVIVFAASDRLFQVPASGGMPRPVTALEPGHGETAHLRPQFLPDGRRIIFIARASNGKGETYIGDLETGERMALADGRGAATFAGGVLLFSRGSTLVAQPFDDERGNVIGDAQTIGGIEALTTDLTKGSAFAASSTVLVFHRHEPRRRQLVWLDREGQVFGREGEMDQVDGFALSPDGRRLALVRREGESDTSSVWLMEIDSRRVTRLASGRGRDEFPVWSPDGSRVAFTSHRDDNQGVHIVVRNLNGMEESLAQIPGAELTDWSRDGRFLMYSARSPKTRSDLWMLPVTGDKKPQALDQTPANESQGTLSPDGRLMAYVSDESGADEVYVRPFPPSEGRWQISTGGGTRPRWRVDGREILYLSPDGQLMAVDVRSSSPLQSGMPQRLLDVPGADDFAIRGGQQFLVQMPVEQAGDRQLEVILNWTAELRR